VSQRAEQGVSTPLASPKGDAPRTSRGTRPTQWLPMSDWRTANASGGITRKGHCH